MRSTRRLAVWAGSVLIALLYGGGSFIAWSVMMWDRTSDSRYAAYAAWTVLGLTGLFMFVHATRSLGGSLYGLYLRRRSGVDSSEADARAEAVAVAKIDESVVRTVLMRCERAGCPPWVGDSVDAWFRSDERPSTRLELLARLYRYSAFSTDPYAPRKAVNDLRLAIRGDTEGEGSGSRV